MNEIVSTLRAKMVAYEQAMDGFRDAVRKPGMRAKPPTNEVVAYLHTLEPLVRKQLCAVARAMRFADDIKLQYDEIQEDDVFVADLTPEELDLAMLTMEDAKLELGAAW